MFNYTGGDVVLDIAEDHGKLVRCHNLIWESELPTWLTSQTWDNATLIQIMKSHITNLVEQYVCFLPRPFSESWLMLAQLGFSVNSL